VHVLEQHRQGLSCRQFHDQLCDALEDSQLVLSLARQVTISGTAFRKQARQTGAPDRSSRVAAFGFLGHSSGAQGADPGREAEDALTLVAPSKQNPTATLLRL
jgi:hypothetical protein